MVLWAYMAAHLLNHALGLYSLGAAELGMSLAVALWHSMPGTIVLYGAFAIHLALALDSLYRRPHLLGSPLELLRIAFGLAFPLLLVGHAVTTRVAFEWYGWLPAYQRVVASLVSAGAEGRQLALLAPGWAHGCMGLHFALKKRKNFHRWQGVFVALATLLPLAAGAGFLVMEAEVASLMQSDDWKAEFGHHPSTTQLATLGELRDQLLAIYLGLIVAALLARAIRMLWRLLR